MNSMPGRHVVVIGQGYVGLPLARAISAAGIPIVGLDINAAAVAALNAGRSPVDDVSNADLARMLARGYTASTDAQVIADADVVVLCVPTPLDSRREPDLGAVLAATRDTARYLTPGTLVILESTTYPGTTDDVLRPILEEPGHRIDEDFWLAFSPERIDPGNREFGLENTPKLVGGVTTASTARATAFYQRFVGSVVPTKGAKEAETAKLLENTYRHINIALVNEVTQLCHELGIDVWDVIRAAGTKPFGFQAFQPGPGVGGHCIPIDPRYLNYAAKDRLGQPFRFIELAEEINLSMPKYTVDRLQSLLAEHGVEMSGANVLVLGVTYKANISDQRESPAPFVVKELRTRGAHVVYHDPRVAEWTVGAIPVPFATDLDAAMAAADVVVLLQAHREYDIAELVVKSKLLFDTRGVTTGAEAKRL